MNEPTLSIWALAEPQGRSADVLLVALGTGLLVLLLALRWQPWRLQRQA